MSKNTNHYNWQNWISQTNIKNNKKKKVLNEMKQNWVDAIYDAIVVASQRKQSNFKRYFGEENRIVVPYDTSKMTKLAYLIAICAYLAKIESKNKEVIYRKNLYKKYLNIDVNYDEQKMRWLDVPEGAGAKLEEVIPDNLKDNYGAVASPFMRDLMVVIEDKVVKQKGRAAGGAEITKDLTLYVPFISYFQYEPWSEKTPQKVIDEKGKFRKTEINLSIGEMLTKHKQNDLLKWWQENQYSFVQDLDVVNGAVTMYRNDHDDIKHTLDIESLKNKFEMASTDQKSEYSILISRAPIDVLRMSDFLRTGLDSCHVYPNKTGSSYSGEYFYCALAESRNQGAIAFMLRTEDLEKVDINNPEIFSDPDRNIQGIEPLARVRLRRIVDQNSGVDFMVPEERVYGRQKFSAFTDTVEKWVVNKTSKFILNDEEGTTIPEIFYIPDENSMVLLGGSYTDSGQRQLTSEFKDIVTKSAVLAARTPEEKSLVKDYFDDLMYDTVSYEGEENEDEAVDQCTDLEELVSEAGSEFERKASPLSIEVSVDECSADSMTILTVIKANDSFRLDSDLLEAKVVDQTKLKELFYNNNQKSDLRRILEKRYSEELLGRTTYINIFKESDISVYFDLYTGPEIYISIDVSNSFPNYNEFYHYLDFGSLAVRKSYESSDLITIFIEELEKLEIVKKSVFAEEETQQLIQNFAESLTVDKNHFKHNDFMSDEGKYDVFSMVSDPSRITHESNYPIIARIPVSDEEDSKGVKVSLVKALNLSNKLLSNFAVKNEILTKIDTMFVGPPEHLETASQQKLPFELNVEKDVIDIIRSKNIPLIPQTDKGIQITFYNSSDDIEQARRFSGFLNIRMRINVTMDSEMENQQEIINAMNFIDVAGSKENYKKIVDASSEVVNKYLKTWMKEAPNIYTSKEKEVAKIPTEPLKPSGDLDVDKTPLFSGTPHVAGGDMVENKKKKLVINERFKRLIRNMKK